jgi:hypothetical protein
MGRHEFTAVAGVVAAAAAATAREIRDALTGLLGRRTLESSKSRVNY